MDPAPYHPSPQSTTSKEQGSPRISLIDMTIEVVARLGCFHYCGNGEGLRRLTNEFLWKVLHMNFMPWNEVATWRDAFRDCLEDEEIKQTPFDIVTLEQMCLKYVSFVYNGICENSAGDAVLTKKEVSAKATEMSEAVSIFTPPVPQSATPPSGLKGSPLPSGTHSLKDILTTTIRATWHYEGDVLEKTVREVCKTILNGVDAARRVRRKISPDRHLPLEYMNRENWPHSWAEIHASSLGDILKWYSLFYHDAKDKHACRRAEVLMLESISFPDPKPERHIAARDFLVREEETERIYLPDMLEHVSRTTHTHARPCKMLEHFTGMRELDPSWMALYAGAVNPRVFNETRHPRTLDDLVGTYLTSIFKETLAPKDLDLAKQTMLRSLTLAKPPASPDNHFLRLMEPCDWPVQFGLEEMARAVVGAQGPKSRKDEDWAVRRYLDSVLHGKMLGLSLHRHADAALRTIADALAVDETEMLRLAERGRTLKRYANGALHGKLPNAPESSGDEAAGRVVTIGDLVRLYKTKVLCFEEKPPSSERENSRKVTWLKNFTVERTMCGSISFAKPIVTADGDALGKTAAVVHLTDGKSLSFPGRHRSEIVKSCYRSYGVPNFDFGENDYRENLAQRESLPSQRDYDRTSGNPYVYDYNRTLGLPYFLK